MLEPWLRVKTIAELDLDMLERSGVRGVITDVDDTLTPWHGMEVHPHVAGAYARLKQRFKVGILSNCGPKRYAQLQEIFTDVPIVPHGNRKPGKAGFVRALELLGCEAGEAVMIGDRLLTDVLGANRIGIRSVLVEALGTPEPMVLTVMRKIERGLLAMVGG